MFSYFYPSNFVESDVRLIQYMYVIRLFMDFFLSYLPHDTQFSECIFVLPLFWANQHLYRDDSTHSNGPNLSVCSVHQTSTFRDECINSIVLDAPTLLSCEYGFWNCKTTFTFLINVVLDENDLSVHSTSTYHRVKQQMWLQSLGTMMVNPCAEHCRRWIYIIIVHFPTIIISDIVHRHYIHPYNKSLPINRRFWICRQTSSENTHHAWMARTETVQACAPCRPVAAASARKKFRCGSARGQCPSSTPTESRRQKCQIKQEDQNIQNEM